MAVLGIRERCNCTAEFEIEWEDQYSYLNAIGELQQWRETHICTQRKYVKAQEAASGTIQA